MNKVITMKTLCIIAHFHFEHSLRFVGPGAVHRSTPSRGAWVSHSVAARGEIAREGCEISSLVEHMGLSPWLFL